MHSVGRMQPFSMLKRVVHIVTTGLYRVNVLSHSHYIFWPFGLESELRRNLSEYRNSTKTIRFELFYYDPSNIENALTFLALLIICV
jgi:hypothetical protein